MSLNWDAGTPAWRDAGIEAEIEVAAGERALLALTSAYAEPLIFPGRRDVLTRLETTIDFWQSWSRAHAYEGPWADLVVPQRARPEADDLRSVGRVGRGADHLVAGGDRRAAQLGLPLLLDSRLQFHDRRAAAARLPRRGALALLVVHAGDGAHRASRFTSSTGSTAGSGPPSGRSICPAIAGRGRYGSATARSNRRSWTSTAPCSKRRGSTARGITRSIRTPARCSRASPTTCATSGASRTRASGRSATARFSSPTRR